MKRFSSIGGVASWMATMALVGSPTATTLADEPESPTVANTAARAFEISDVSLDVQGALVGQAVSTQGAPAAGATVVLDNGRQQWQATTDAEGRFRFESLAGGNYRVQTADQVRFCRVWKDGTAPPAAKRGLLIVEGEQTILGQYCGHPVVGCGSPVTGCGSPVTSGMQGCKALLSNPLVIGGVIAAAIAIPIAVHNADDDDPSS